MSHEAIIQLVLIASLSVIMSVICLLFAHNVRGRKLPFLLVIFHYIFVMLAAGSAIGGIVKAGLREGSDVGPVMAVAIIWAALEALLGTASSYIALDEAG